MFDPNKMTSHATRLWRFSASPPELCLAFHVITETRFVLGHWGKSASEHQHVSSMLHDMLSENRTVALLLAPKTASLCPQVHRIGRSGDVHARSADIRQSMWMTAPT